MATLTRPGLPTRGRDWRLMARTVRLVLSVPHYAALAVAYGYLGLSVFVFARNLDLLTDVVLLGGLPLAARLTVLVEMYPGVSTAYTVEQSVVLLVTAALIGVDLAMLTYHVREHRLTLRDGSGSLTGVLLGTLGGGCAACGSALFVGILSLVGAGGLLTALPLDGLEFALGAVVLLVLSIYWLADGMRGGEVAGCPVELDG